MTDEKSDLPIDLGDLRGQEPDWDAIRKDPDVQAATRQARKDEEVEDIEAFLEAYPRATGEELVFEEVSESPDAICVRADGSQVGVEITNVRRSPDQAFCESIRHQDEMDCEEAVDEVVRLVEQKAEKLPNFKTPRTILVVALCEADILSVANLLKLVPIEDWKSYGFDEIWLADFKGIRDGAHREVRLFGLYPEEYRVLVGRSDFDQKPYG